MGCDLKGSVSIVGHVRFVSHELTQVMATLVSRTTLVCPVTLGLHVVYSIVKVLATQAVASATVQTLSGSAVGLDSCNPGLVLFLGLFSSTNGLPNPVHLYSTGGRIRGIFMLSPGTSPGTGAQPDWA